MNDKIKLIACDLDGTLLQHGASKCDEELFGLINAFMEKGVLFVPASGRQYPNLQRLFAPVQGHLLYVCENGSLVIHKDSVLLKRQFTEEMALALCHAVLDYPACEVLISGERVSYLVPKDVSFVSHMRDVVGNDVCVVECPEAIKEPIIKVSYFTAAEKRDAATVHFTKLFQEKCQIMTSGNQWVDFAPFGTSKGSALQEIGKKLNILPQEMAAFGDNENDRSMLEFVGHPYLMEDSNPSIFDIAGERCRKVEETLCRLLDRL